MIVSQLLNTSFPSLNISDKPSFALQLMDDYDVLHLPVLSEEKYVGLVSKEDLLDAIDADMHLSDPEILKRYSIHQEEHFLGALKQIAAYELSLLPVVSAQMELQGVLLTKEFLKGMSTFLGN
ncbi:MAG: CBS domain-containing protein, partial [Sediminibacterium sp.]|nr:CBS domain-containing protein [Sediminibacterium sp.]